MTTPTHSKRRAVRASLAVALLGAATLAACNQDKLLKVPTPDVVLPGDIASKAALPSAFASAVGDFQLAYAGGYGGQLPLLDYNEGYAQITALGLRNEAGLPCETFFMGDPLVVAWLRSYGQGLHPRRSGGRRS